MFQPYFVHEDPFEQPYLHIIHRGKITSAEIKKIGNW
jgi:hypothetical protein